MKGCDAKWPSLYALVPVSYYHISVANCIWLKSGKCGTFYDNYLVTHLEFSNVPNLKHYSQHLLNYIVLTNGLNLFNSSEFLIIKDLIKIDNDFIQETNTFNTLVNIFRVELGEIGNGSEKDSSIVSALCIQFLKIQ